ncbi:MAG: hypothetical protein FWH25_02030 [Syntrophorhabdaceae bacterium]|nr:hypothetical protein [Syntrophorhabdaceae bacterium]
MLYYRIYQEGNAIESFKTIKAPFSREEFEASGSELVSKGLWGNAGIYLWIRKKNERIDPWRMMKTKPPSTI